MLRAPTPPKTASPSAWQAEPPPGGPTWGCTHSLTRLPAVSVHTHPCALMLSGMCHSQDDPLTLHTLPCQRPHLDRPAGLEPTDTLTPPTHTRAHTRPGSHMHTRPHACAHADTRACTHVSLHTHAHTRAHTCLHTRAHAHTRPTRVLAHLCSHVHAPTHVPQMHTHAYTRAPTDTNTRACNARTCLHTRPRTHVTTRTRVCRWPWPSFLHQKPVWTCTQTRTGAHTQPSHSLSHAHVGRQVYTRPSVRTGTRASRGDRGEEAKRGGTKGTGREGGTAHPHAGLPGAGWALPGPQGRCMAGAGGGGRWGPRGTRWYWDRQGALPPKCDLF